MNKNGDKKLGLARELVVGILLAALASVVSISDATADREMLWGG